MSYKNINQQLTLQHIITAHVGVPVSFEEHYINWSLPITLYTSYKELRLYEPDFDESFKTQLKTYCLQTGYKYKPIKETIDGISCPHSDLSPIVNFGTLRLFTFYAKDYNEAEDIDSIRYVKDANGFKHVFLFGDLKRGAAKFKSKHTLADKSPRNISKYLSSYFQDDKSIIRNKTIRFN